MRKLFLSLVALLRSSSHLLPHLLPETRSFGTCKDKWKKKKVGKEEHVRSHTFQSDLTHSSIQSCKHAPHPLCLVIRLQPFLSQLFLLLSQNHNVSNCWDAPASCGFTPTGDKPGCIRDTIRDTLTSCWGAVLLSCCPSVLLLRQDQVLPFTPKVRSCFRSEANLAGFRVKIGF